jgi:hypothetical protein
MEAQVIFISLVLFYRVKKGGLVVLEARKLVGPGITCHFQKIPAEFGVYLPFKKYQPKL